MVIHSVFFGISFSQNYVSLLIEIKEKKSFGGLNEIQPVLDTNIWRNLINPSAHIVFLLWLRCL